MNVRLSSIDNGHITYTWDSVDFSCPATHYFINASGCGECPNTTHSVNITCLTELNEQPQVCSLSVQTVLCGHLFGNHSSINQFRIRGVFTLYSKNSETTIGYD